MLLQSVYACDALRLTHVSVLRCCSTKYPGTYSVALDVYDGLSSITTVLDKQVEKFAETVKADPKLANGFHAVGMSQGNLVVRYVHTTAATATELLNFL